MTIRHDIGQLLWVGFDGTRAPRELVSRIVSGRVGATVLFKRNLIEGAHGTDIDELAALIDELHQAAPDGARALVAVDQEGGRVQRLRAPATQWPPMLALDRIGGARAIERAEQFGEAIGRELRAIGFDVDFAPVLDVHTNPANPIIGDRAFASEPAAAADRGLAFARGLARAGVLSCGKHFPGHGDTSTDSHLELPRIDHDWQRIERVELEPFRRAAAAGLPMIMTAHVVFAAVDATQPATLSRAVVHELLRERIGYRGVVISDDLDMKAIDDPAVAAIEAIAAGCDVLLLCKEPAHQAAAEEALIRHCERDSGFADRVREAAARVRAMKASHAAAHQTIVAPGRDVIGCAAHRELAAL